MELFDHLALGFSTALSLQNLAYAFIGCVLGTLIGVLPGIGPIATIAMLLPVTYALPPVASLIMLAGIYYGAQYGGSTTAILVNLPGEASSVVTMHRRLPDGAATAGPARRSPLPGSARSLPATVATLLLARLRAAARRNSRCKFGPADYFSLMVLGLIGAVVLASGSLLEGDRHDRAGPAAGPDRHRHQLRRARFTFDVPRADRRHRLRRDGHGHVRLRRRSSRTWSRRKPSETFTTQGDQPVADQGRLPAHGPGGAAWHRPGFGAGHPARRRCGSSASFAAYSLEKKASKYAHEFGKGAIEGVAGPESANNAARPDVLHSAADAGHSAQRRDGADDGRHDDPRHPAGPAGDDQQPGAVLGPDRLDVDRQPDAGHPEPADDRHLGEAADRAVSLPVPGDSRVLRALACTRSTTRRSMLFMAPASA